MSLLHNAATKLQGETRSTTSTGADEHAIDPHTLAPPVTFHGEFAGLEEIFGAAGPFASAFHAASTALATGTGVRGPNGGTRPTVRIIPELHSQIEGVTSRVTTEVAAPSRLTRVASSIRGDLNALFGRLRGSQG